MFVSVIFPRKIVFHFTLSKSILLLSLSTVQMWLIPRWSHRSLALALRHLASRRDFSQFKSFTDDLSLSLFFAFLSHFSPPSFPAFDSFHWVYYTPRPWFREIEVEPRLAPNTVSNFSPLSALRLSVWFTKHMALLIWRCKHAHQVPKMWAVCTLVVSDCRCPGSKIKKI